jgi:cation:H+ antiporter
VEIVLSIAGLIAGLALLEVGADRLTEDISRLARQLRASEHVVGLLTAGGEWEELAVVLLALGSGHPGLAVGNVIGACLANLIGSMPLGFLGSRPLVPDRGARVYGVVMLLVTALVGMLLFGGMVGPVAGSLLVALFLLYASSVLLVMRRGWLRPIVEDDDDDAMPSTARVRLVLALAVSLLVIGAGAELIVQGAVRIAEAVGLSDYAIGATVVAIGTTLPDKAISFIGGRRGQSGVVTANATGSNIFVLTLVLGLAALFSGDGLSVTQDVIRIDVPLLLVVSALVVALFMRPSIGRRAGAGLLVLYAAYLVFALIRGA